MGFHEIKQLSQLPIDLLNWQNSIYQLLFLDILATIR